jgi:hypothetical protein
MAAAIAKTWSSVAVGRSSALSCPAARMRQIAAHQVVVDGRREDRMQDAVRLRDRRLAHAIREPFGSPGSDVRGQELREPPVGQVRKDV